MRLSRYTEFISESKNSIDSICKKYHIHGYTINEDGSIDVNEEVDLHNKMLTKLPLKFNKINGIFACNDNSLTSLEGCPRYVAGGFYCYNNYLDSLVGGPESVGGDFYCSDNHLRSLEGFPEFYEGKVFIEYNSVYEIIRLFPKNKYDKAITWLNEFDVIRDGYQVVMDRLEEVFVQMSLEIPKDLKFNNYKII